MSDFAFIPTDEQIKSSNIFSFMQKYNITSLEELSKKATNDLEWFWKSVDKDIGIIWDKKYEKVFDFSKGYPWAKWFVNGKIGRASCRERV